MPQNLFGSKKGVSVIEILIVTAVLSITLASFLGLINFSLTTATLVKQTTKGNALAQEVMEAARSFRDRTEWSVEGLGSLNNNAAYHPEKTLTSPPEWDLVLGQESADGFTREVVFEAVYRDANDDIALVGSLDEDTKKATVTVSWEERGRQHEVVLASYFTNWQKQ